MIQSYSAVVISSSHSPVTDHSFEIRHASVGPLRSMVAAGMRRNFAECNIKRHSGECGCRVGQRTGK